MGANQGKFKPERVKIKEKTADMQEIILYAILTLIVGGMLYAVLGRNVGPDVDKPIDPKEILTKLHPEDRPAPKPEISGPHAEGLKAIAELERGFNPDRFLDQAKMAYGMILEAYAEGDRDTLAGLLNDEVKASYFAAIDEREDKGLTQVTDLADLREAEIVSAERNGRFGRIRVRFVADLATALKDKDGNIVQGDPDVLARVREVWSFEKDLKSKNPAWYLAGVEPHTSDDKTGAPDHSPDV